MKTKPNKEPILPVVYVTKYALTKGILVFRNAKHCLSAAPDGTMIAIDGVFMQFFHGKDWHLTLEEAQKDAEERRIRKLKNIDKQAKRMAALKIEVVDAAQVTERPREDDEE